MTIKRLSKNKNQDVKNTDPVHVERLTEKFIGSGGKTTSEAELNSNKSGNDEEMRFTLRVPKNMIKEIDEIRKRQAGSVSRNTWILQSVSDSLMSK